MINCEKCIHYSVCNRFADGLAEHFCTDYLGTCKDCEYAKNSFYVDSKWCASCRDMNNSRIFEDDFCSRWKKKGGDE